MKWIVVILVLLNLTAWLLGKRLDPDAYQAVNANQVETINAAAMSVVKPPQEMPAASEAKSTEAVALEGDSLAQLKVDKRGQVLMAPQASKPKKVVDNNQLSESSSVASATKMNSKAIIAPLDRAKAEAVAEPTPEPIKVAKVAAPEPQPAPEPTAKIVLACYRLGPFKDKNGLTAVRRQLENGGAQYTVDEAGAAKKIKAARVYLDAYANSAAVEVETKRLKKMNIEHFVGRLNGAPLIQLGYFSEPERAKAYQKKLKARGINAKIDMIYHDVTIQTWLDVQLAAKGSIKALGLPATIKVKQQDCR